MDRLKLINDEKKQQQLNDKIRDIKERINELEEESKKLAGTKSEAENAEVMKNTENKIL